LDVDLEACAQSSKRIGISFAYSSPFDDAILPDIPANDKVWVT